MKKKKILKKVLIILAICLIIFFIDLGRKVYIISAYSEEAEKYSNVTNYYQKRSEEENVTVEFWRKDNLAIYKRTSEDGVRMIYYDEGYNWIIVDTNDENNNITKVAIKVSNIDGIIMQSFGNNYFYVENFWQALTVALSSKITTEKLDNIECYKISFADDFQIFADKDNYLTIKEINGSTNTGVIEYELNQVTDEEVQLPNLEGFEIRQNS